MDNTWGPTQLSKNPLVDARLSIFIQALGKQPGLRPVDRQAVSGTSVQQTGRLPP